LETGVELDEDGEIGQDENLEAFEDFIDTLDLDDLGNK
jgi:hypothetical protein